MQYSKIQKSISSLILFSLLFGLTFRVPFFDYKTYAGNSDYYDLVSIIVDEDTYDSISSEIKRYASDIQGVLENTKVVIVPTPVNTTAFNIASLNEGLYYNGYKAINKNTNFESKLVGTVLVGNFNLPVVYNENESSKTIVPFTDFEDKVYIYDHKTKTYKKNESNKNGLKSEIWHGVISPNLGDLSKNIEGLKEYFNKNHDFYEGTGNFKLSDGILNGNNSEGVSVDYKPFVFYYDQFREEKGLNYTLYKGYEAYLNNKEDIVYNRFTKELADKVSDVVLGKANDEISGMVDSLSTKIDGLGSDSPFNGVTDEMQNLSTSGPDSSKSPDIQTRFITENMTKKFLEVFAKGIIGDFRTNVHNAGRYSGTGGEVNVDLIPYLITVLDLVNDSIIKDVNTEVENNIDDLVKDGLSRNIAIPDYIKEYKFYSHDDGSGLGSGIEDFYDANCYDLDKNYLYGNNSDNINTAKDCSIYRGNTNVGGKLVEANRGLNVNLSLGDKDRINNTYCLQNLSSGASLKGLWGGNSPLNIDRSNLTDANIKLASHDVNGAIEPLYNIGGSVESLDQLKNPSPLDCFDNNLLSDTRKGWSDWSLNNSSTCETSFKTKSTGWSCTYDNLAYKNNFNIRFEDFYKNTNESGLNTVDKDYCATTDSRGLITEFKDNGNTFNINEYYTKKEYQLNGSGFVLDYDCVQAGLYKENNFKIIPSYITHKSPNSDEIKGEIDAQMTSDLPVDKDRYIDFIGAKGDLLKINYPALFRINVGDKTRITLESVSASLEASLRVKSIEINKMINDNNPDSLSGKDLELYDILKIKDGAYPSADFDLLSFLKNKPAKTITVGDETKTISYYDSLVFAIYWNNLSSVSAKYGAIFDNYLNDDLSADTKYFLPKNKKEYEISYLGAPGDAENMYIKMDPESKGDNPYSDELSDNLNLSSALLGANIGDNGNTDSEEGLFKCAPPDGVPIWEWIPAVMCRLGEMMPPSISLSDGACGPSLLDLTSDSTDGSDLLNDLTSDGIKQCNGDFDKNGINDCIENKLGDSGILELTSDSKKYFYNKNANLNATFKDKNGKVVTLLNNSKVKFEIEKIEIAKDKTKSLSDSNKEIVYDLNDLYKNNTSIINEYVTFKDLDVNVTLGKANYGIGLKGKDANIYLKSTISLQDNSGKESIFLESNPLLIQIRGDRLFNSSYKLINTSEGLVIDSGSDYLKVSDNTNIIIADKNRGGIEEIKNLVNNSSLANEKSLIILDNISSSGESIPIDYPLNIKVKDSKNNTVKELVIDDLNNFKGIDAIKKSGSYKIEIADSKGFTSIRNIELIPESPYTVETNLGATVMEKGGNVSTNFFTIYDKYLNVITGDFINYKINIDGKGVVFLDNELSSYEGTTFEGYKVFRLKSTDIIGDNQVQVIIYDNDGNELIRGVNDLRVADKINFEAKLLSDKLEVGYNKYKYEVSLKDENGNLLTDFNSRVYLNSSPIYIKTSGTYALLKDGKAEIEFETKTVAGKNIGLEFQIEGINDILKKEITILPAKPVKIDIVMSKNKLEASPDASSDVQIELKDRYNNIAFNDNSTRTSLEILDQYSNIITSGNKISTVREGVGSYTINGTLNPGVAYFKIITIPSLSNNSFIVKDKSNELIVKGVGNNAGKIETFYFWNDEKIKGKKYNSLYTTLLGSNYGDIYKEGYLAGSLLFNKNNRALAVTSLLNNPFNYSDVLNLSENGKLEVVTSSSDLTQDLDVTTEFINNNLSLNLYNKPLKTYIGKIYYNFDDNTNLIACTNETLNCLDNNNTSISIKSLSENYNVYLSNDELIFRNIDGKNLFTINKNGTFDRTGIVSFSYNKENIGNYLSIYIKSGSTIIGEIGFSIKNGSINTSRSDNVFNGKINNYKNTILVLLKTNSYGTHSTGNIYNRGLSIYYNDPFKNDKALNNFSKENTYGNENFINKPGIGWKEGNKSLLEFAAGKNVGESVKDFMSFSVINLGDPVISLKKIKKKLTGTDIDRQFDSTLGKILSNDDDIVNYRILDYDNDNKIDVLLLKEDKYFKLLENKDINGGLIDKGNLALIVDLGAYDLVKTGDFTGDGYDDVFFVDNKGDPYLLNNVTKNFTRYSLIDNFRLNGKIVRAESFDMDNDGKTDIVTLDDSGEINIFYGGGTSEKPYFSKLTVSEGNGIKLEDTPRSDNSLIYFNGLYQPSENSADNSQFERYLYIKYPFSNNEVTVDYEKVLNQTEQLPSSKASSYFMKTEYSEYAGIRVEKVYKDINAGYLSSGDIVDTTITLTNISDQAITGVNFIEKVPSAFSLDEKTVRVLGDDTKKPIDGDVGYNFLISNLNIAIGEQVVINYKSKVRSIQYSYMEVGLFEKDEVGDDVYGDIIIKKDNQNCSDVVDLFRSTAKRSYLLGTKTPSCDEEKTALPPELEKNTIDENENGIPDYIDELSDPNNTTAMQDYAKEQLEIMNLDIDNDGLPNDEDFIEGSIIGSVFGGEDTTVEVGLGGGLENIDSQLDGIQEVLNGLSCGNASCFASPLNWAPLAPGSDPVFMGQTIGDGLKIDEGLPIISAMTGIPLYGPWGCIPIPMIWPISPIGLDTTCTTNSLGAGGRLGIDSFTNFFRLFITPTLTGGIGTAICFGGSARISGNILPEGLSPLFPSGNCIVIAKKMNSCNGDGSDGDPGSIGIPIYSGDGSFGVINGNCGTTQTQFEKAKEDKLILNQLVENDDENALEKIFGYLPGNFSEEPITPMFTQGGADTEITLDLTTDADGNFDDVIKIQQTRISSFPSWLMDWVTRQIEEIANKLTDFPTLFIILPDFSGVFDKTWGETSGNNNKSSKNAITSNNKTIDKKVEKVNSGIKEAYEFIGSIPLVYIKQETVDINLPWISQAEIDKTILLREATLQQREDEIDRAKTEFNEDIKSGANINGDINVDFDIDFLLDGLRNNLEVIKEYKKIPEKINKLINLKQDYLEQILCNIEVISNILGGRIGKNGDRFKAWVETYILIKAILKSWQLLVDVFIDFESECHECKNERQDALDQEFSLIDMVVPKIPIITWPKWPDIILDLHNIRAGLTVALPEFSVNTKPIILPQLPALYLPSLPEINIDANLTLSLSEMLRLAGYDLPQLPVLPELNIPELPPIPSLPTVNLPDLPPPPKLPKMLGSIEVVLDIIKLLTKAMCMLKSLPITPEWRAGDQIAFLTERSGYLGSDFFEISMPEFSFPFIDAIKVTTYVNMEFDTDFIVELARQIVMPINSMSNDFTNIFSNAIPDLDFRGALPSEINLDVNVDTETLKSLGEGDLSPIKDQFDKNKKGIDKEINNANEKLNESLDKLKNTGYNNKDVLQILLATKLGADFDKLKNVIKEGLDDTVTTTEFKRIINNALASKSVTSEPKMDKILALWNEVNNRTFSKEDEIISELKENNRAKFDALKNIINTEIIKNKELKKNFKSIGNPIVTKVGYQEDNKIDLYNESLTVFNDKFKESAKKLFDYDYREEKELKNMSNDLVSSIKTPLQKYSNAKVDSSREKILSSISNKEIALDVVNTDAVTQNSCQGNQDSEYIREYKGLYILEEGQSYRLFDYLDELKGDEVTKIVDLDNDGDDDLLYFSANRLYFKENLKITDTKVHVNTNPIVVNISDNKYYNGDIFYEAINNAHEIGSDNGSINLGFLAPTNETLNKFRLTFYTIVDKYLNEKDSNYRPKFIKKDIVDGISKIGNSTQIEETGYFIKRKNLVYIKNLGDLLGAKVVSKELKDISINISEGKVVNINKGTSIYAGANSFTIRYLNEDTGDKTEYSLKINGYENIEFKNNIKIIGIDGSAYIKGYEDIIYEGSDIRKLLDKPLFSGSTISYVGNNYETLDSSYIELEYYDRSELSLDFNYVSKWELYDLGLKTSDYSIRVTRDNDYYYAKINTFGKNINGTLSKQILFAPQGEADMNAPELTLSSIKIPVYQDYIVDLTNDVYEDSGIKNIKKVIIDFDLTKDTNNDGNPKNDDDININGEYKNQVDILKNPAYLKFNFKSFDKLFKKQIGITLIDTNDNIGYGEVTLEVYSPIPHINGYDNGLINGILINETLTDEPVRLYKFRGGLVDKLIDTDGKDISYTNDGSFRFNVKTSGTGLKLYDSGKNELAYIEEKTGKITLNDHSITNEVLSSSNINNDSVFPKILLKKNGKDIFYEYLELNGVNEVQFVNNFEEVKDKGIYFKFSDFNNYSYYIVPLGLDYNPGALSIYRNTSTDKEALFTIFNDGRINTINDDDFSIKYDYYGDNVVLKLYDKNDFGKREIGRVLFKNEGEYIMK